MRRASRVEHAWPGVALAATLLVAPAPAAETGTAARALEVHPVELAGQAAQNRAAARLRPLGMLEIPRVKENDLALSQLSGLAWDEDDGVLYAISDRGTLFHLIPQFRGDTLSGLALARALPLRDAAGKPLKGRLTDSEGLDVLNGRNGRRGDGELLVSFERTPRIVRYSPDGRWLGELKLPERLRERNNYDSTNRMLESVCSDPTLGVLTAPEKPLDGEREGETHLYALDDRRWSLALEEGQNISALECLGDGRVLVLARDFGRLFYRQVATLRIARLVRGTTRAAVDAPTTLDASDGWQIDNFEGLARHRGNRFFIVSDDNDLFVQRTLLLYFEYDGAAP